MKQAQTIANHVKSAADATDRAEASAIAKDQNWQSGMTKYTFDDNSVLAVRDVEFFGFDADDADSIGAYAKWLGQPDAQEETEIERLLEALAE